MNIVVVIKQTPDTETVIKIAPNNRQIVTSDIKWIINPYDEFAIEGALRLKEKHGGTVTVMSYGPQRVVDALRTALAMGADDAVLIDDPAMKNADFMRVTRSLAAATREKNPDIIFMGSRTVDYDQGQRGAILAEMLGLPHIALAVSLESDGSKVVVDRPIEGGRVTIEASLPAVVTFGGSHAVWNPRYASLPGIMKAKKKPLAIRKLQDLGLDPADFSPDQARIRITSIEMPPQRKAGKIIDGGLDTEGKARELTKLLREEARVI
ncbi:MAG: electron transfer flavoprotein subunit beta/FixA family protein [Desulfobacteraceae bacterium]|nr:electron transfer flavoprotein subunit beta/FixA family protein [Desulfobacteraceae bacterium]